MHMNELNAYTYNYNFFSRVAKGDEYVGLATSYQRLTSQRRCGNMLENVYHGAIHSAYTFDLGNRLPDQGDEYIQTLAQCQDLYSFEVNCDGDIIDEKGDAGTFNNALSGYALFELPAAVFNRNTGRFNIEELKLWMEAAQFLIDQAGSNRNTIAKRAAAMGIKLDYVVA